MTHRIIRRIVAALVCLLIASITTQAQPGDNVDAIYNDITHEYTLHPDGGITYSYEHHLSLITHFAFDRAHGETFVVYNPAWQTLKVTRSATTMANGTIVESPGNAFNEVLPSFAAGAAPWLGLREMVITHTGIEKGAMIHLAYTITTKPGFMPGLAGRVLFGERNPIRRLTVRVTVPAGTTLHHALMNMGVPSPSGSGAFSSPYGTITQTLPGASPGAGAMTTYTWVAENLPLYPVEPMQKGMWSALPALHFSTMTPEGLRQHNAAGLADGTLPHASAEIVAGAVAASANPVERARLLKKAVDDRFGIMSGDLALTGWRALPAEETFRRGAGSSLDRAVLLAALCRKAGLNAAAALGTIADSREVTRSTPAGIIPSGTAYVVCRGAGEAGSDLVLDPARPQQAPLHRSHLTDVPVLLTTGDAAVPPTTPASSTWSCTITLKADRMMTGVAEATVRGALNPTLEPTRLVSHYRQMLERALPGVKAKGTAGQPGSVSFTLASAAPVPLNGDLLRLTLPSTPGGLAEIAGDAAVVVRGTPIDLHGTIVERSTVTITLPANAGIVTLPAPTTLSTPVGTLTTTVQKKGQVVEVTRSITMTTDTITPDNYGDFQRLVQECAAPDAKTILLKFQ